MFPSLFISHGSPDIRLRDHEVRDFLISLGSKLEKPKSIIIISAHWTTRKLQILSNQDPQLIYDFYGFPDELYETKYPIKNDMQLVEKLSKTIKENGFEIEQNPSREGYDHGVWSVLSLIYPQADIPVVQISLPLSFDIDELLKLGEVLKEFRDSSAIVGSGNITHNLRGVDWREGATIKPYAKEFRDWLIKNIEDKNIEQLKQLEHYPYLRENHPTLEHLLPLYVVLGSSTNYQGKSLIENYMFGNLAMDTIIFE